MEMVAAMEGVKPAPGANISHANQPRVAGTVQTRWLHLITGGDRPELSDSSSASLDVGTNVEMAWRAFREGALEYVPATIVTMMLTPLSVTTQGSP